MRYKIPIEIIEIEWGNYHPVVSSEFINGRKGYWVIDTGASKTVFDKNQTELILSVEDETEDLHAANMSEEPLKTSLGYLKKFAIGKFSVENLKVALLDMNHINELYSKVTDLEICGLLGSDFLVEYKAVIDYKKRRLILCQNSTIDNR